VSEAIAMTRETEVLKTLLEVSRLISSNYPIPKVIKRICGKLRKLLGTDDCSIMILNEKSRELAFSESSGLTRWEMKNIRFNLGEGVAGWVAKHKKPVLIEDVRTDVRFKVVDEQKRCMISMISSPLMVKRRVIGVVSLTTREEGHVFTQDELELVVLMSAHISLALENNRLYEISVLDGLTNIYNRRYLEQRLVEEVAYSKRYTKPLSVVLLDIDFFKRLNDTYGHQAGDHVLKKVSAILSDALREYDIVARYGGEEFAIILPTTPKQKSATIAERLRLAVCEKDFRFKDDDISCSISLGVACFPEDGKDPDSLVASADAALYKAKESGRNQVALA
jgi:diguanylate cyclase (GGDEF)-like protein